MKYDISSKKAPAMPNLGTGTECIKMLLSQASNFSILTTNGWRCVA